MRLIATLPLATLALLAGCGTSTDQPANVIENETTVRAGNTMDDMQVAPGMGDAYNEMLGDNGTTMNGTDGMGANDAGIDNGQ